MRNTKKHERYVRKRVNGKEKLEHVIVAEKALGKPLPVGACVHHHDEDKKNNAPNNLVICPSNAYHRLLHRRMESMKASGNPDWLRCLRCGVYDDPAKMYVSSKYPVHYHRECNRIYEQKTRRSA
jgi:hypothetical protein